MNDRSPARAAILDRLRRRARPVEHPGPWRSNRRFDSLAERFTGALAAAGGEVHRVADLEAAWTAVDALLDQLGAQRIVVNGAPSLLAAGLPARHPGRAWHVVGHTPGDLRAFCAAADAGISGCAAALAETGSVLLHSGPARSRLATLLPPVHIAVVPVTRLTADLFTWTAAREGPWPANAVLVSGPSKTADIEQTMAVGVHGPKRFIALLVDDPTAP